MITPVTKTYLVWDESDLIHPKLSFAHCVVKISKIFGKKRI